MSELIIQNIKNKDVSYTKYGNSKYSSLWYTDNINKICITFSPRGGCSISFQLYLDLIGLLEDGLNYDKFIHLYRNKLFNPNIKYTEINKLIDQKYIFIKFIMNPYIRAVSIYNAQTSHNLSFREYLKLLVNNKIDFFNNNDAFHYHQQYIDGEENIITKYIKIDKYEKYIITLNNNLLYELDVNKYTSYHHHKRTDNTEFCGDIEKNIIRHKLPKSYKFFYDEEIKKLVEIFYKNDIEKYEYSFDDF